MIIQSLQQSHTHRDETAEGRRNVVLERLLGRAGWTPENLGDHVNQLAQHWD